MKISRSQIRKIVRSTRLAESPRYLDSSEEKAMAKERETFAGDTILELETLLDLNYHRFTDEESEILDQALQILNSRLG
jgi:hypothetical protein